MFDNKNEKLQWKLTNDASTMGYAIFLKSELNGGHKFSEEDQAEVWMNTFIVQLIQIGLLGLCLYHASHSNEFIIFPASGLDLMCARFIGSMLMHINVEKDVRQGLMMMKYAVNHRENFHNVYPAYFVGFL